MNMTKELKLALKRVPAPPGLADRAVARVKLTKRRSFRTTSRVAAIFLLATLVALGGHRYLEQQKTRQGESAKQQLMIALQITAEKTDLARRAMND